jgi:hypothetical protein
MTTQGDIQAAERNSDESRKYFTVDEANRSLPYVRRIIEDIRATYQRAVHLQQKLDEPMQQEILEAVQVDYEEAVDALNRFVEELHTVGVELKDYELGLIDFPALAEGREVYLCWRRGEDRVNAWHEVDAGFAGRKDLATLKLD